MGTRNQGSDHSSAQANLGWHPFRQFLPWDAILKKKLCAFFLRKGIPKEECGQETNSGLTNPGGSGPVNGAQFVDHVGLGHPDTGVDEGEGLGISVQDDLDEELLLVVQFAGVSQGLVPEKL